MSRNIVLLSDGTGNSAAKVWRTNVWRTFEALDLSGSDQIACYDDGVGTSPFKPLAILGGMFGTGLQRNVITLYKFACRNYRDGDRLYGFGFSRGGFTIRIVMALILHEGLVQARTETELHRRATAAYRNYRKKRYHTVWRIESVFRWLRDLLPWFKYDPTGNRPIRQIRFIGVWDTVSAYGMPVDEMTRGISKWIYPLELPDHDIVRPRVARACQALAIDEERKTFHPELWNERSVQASATAPAAERFVHDEHISQVWFAGVHSNVGGGYPDDSLAYIPFVWMIEQARHCGLKFKSDQAGRPYQSGLLMADPDTFKSAIARRDKDGRLYDPRQGLGGIYRYFPRHIACLCDERFSRSSEVYIARPKIHESVFRRIDNHAHAYAPVGLPATYDVVTDHGRIVTADEYHRANAWAENEEGAQRRAGLQEQVWRIIRARQWLYFVTMAAAVWLVAVPFIRDTQPNDELYSKVRWLSAIIRFVGEVLPGFASPWIEAYAREPVLFVVSALVFAILVSLNTRIAGRIGDAMGLLWKPDSNAPAPQPGTPVRSANDGPAYIWKRVIAPLLYAVVSVYVLIAAANKASFVIYDVAGYTCIDGKRNASLDPARTLTRGATASSDFNIRNFCNRTGITLEGNGARYLVKINVKHNPEDQWRDGRYAIPPGGFSASAPTRSCPWTAQSNRLIEQASWGYTFYSALGWPWLRRYSKKWDRILLRIGSEGAEEDDYKPDAGDCFIQWRIAPKKNGELFVYINDAVIGLPGLTDYFYRNNVGTGTIEIKRL